MVLPRSPRAPLSRFLASIAGDIHFAMRHFRRTPVVTGTLVAVLAIGIGAHGAIFAFAQAALMRPVAGVPHNNALVRIRGTEERDSTSHEKYPRGLSYPELLAMAGRREQFRSVAGWVAAPVTVATDRAAPIRIGTAHFATDNLFATLGLQVAVGRDLADSAVRGAVISDQLWRDLYAAAPDVVGRSLRVDDTEVRIVGVAPPRFQGPAGPEGDRALWLPLAARRIVLGGGADALANRDSMLFNAVAEMRAGIGLPEANRTVAAVAAASLAHAPPVAGVYRRGADAVALRGSTSLPVAWSENVFFIKYGATVALIILVLVCINVSALQVGAARARRQEIAIRVSLGASRGRIVRQLLTESILVAVMGGAAGLLLYVVLIHEVAAARGSLQVNPDLGTALYTLCFAAGTGILFGLSPALHATRVTPGEAMKDAGGTTGARSRLQERFIVAQVALTQPLLLAIGIAVTQVVLPATGTAMAHSMSDQVVRLDPAWWTAGERWRDAVPELRQAVERVGALPGVVGVARLDINRRVATVATLAPAGNGRVGARVSAEYRSIEPGYLALLEIPVRQGREFAWDDSLRADEPVLLSATFAHRLFGTESAVGKRLLLQLRGGSTRDHAVILGVMDQPPLGALPSVLDMALLARERSMPGSWLVRTSGPAEAMIPRITGDLAAAVPQVAVAAGTLAEIDRAAGARTFWTSIFITSCGLVALLLCSLGLFAIVSLSVHHHRREIGIRLALGARAGQVVWIFLGRGLRLAIRGTVYGLPISLAGFLLVARLQVWRETVGAGLAVGAVVLGVATLASWIPAQRAAGVAPVEAMRGR